MFNNNKNYIIIIILLIADNLDRAVKHFKLISTLRTPMEKIKCLTNSIRILMSQPIYLSTDSLFDDKKGKMPEIILIIIIIIIIIIINFNSNIISI